MIRSTLRNAGRGRANNNAETMAVFGMASVVMIFLPVIFLMTKAIAPAAAGQLSLPPAFSLSTIVILASSFTLHRANQAKLQDRARPYRQMLIITLALSVLFLALQWIGWQSLIGQYQLAHITFNYVLVLGVIHGLHLLIGIGVLVWLILRCRPARNGTDLYIHFLNPKNELTHRILSHYWHFIDFLWVLMFVIMVLKLW